MVSALAAEPRRAYCWRTSPRRLGPVSRRSCGASGWPATPWGDCTVCSGLGSGLVPAEGLLVGLALIPGGRDRGRGASPVVPGRCWRGSRCTAPRASGSGRGGPGRAPARSRYRRRRRDSAIAAVVAVAALGSGGAAVHLYSNGDDQDATTLTRGRSERARVPAYGVRPLPLRRRRRRRRPRRRPPRRRPVLRRRRALRATPQAIADEEHSGPPAPSSAAPAPKPPKPSLRPHRPASGMAEPGHPALVNAERAKEGCGPVSGPTVCSTTAAQRHSADMAASDYFYHLTGRHRPGRPDHGRRISVDHLRREHRQGPAHPRRCDAVMDGQPGAPREHPELLVQGNRHRAAGLGRRTGVDADVRLPLSGTP
ncbi:hypothetical protein SVIOM74S_08003 [Streptomyces violarus]